VAAMLHERIESEVILNIDFNSDLKGLILRFPIRMNSYAIDSWIHRSMFHRTLLSIRNWRCNMVYESVGRLGSPTA